MHYPALAVADVDADMLEAVVDDFSPTAIEARDGTITIFFTDAHARDAASAAVLATWPSAHLTAREVDDGDWARRSQENLTPVTVGRITVAPPWNTATASDQRPASSAQAPITLVITPSMGFGTGHHATTRLCLAALQTLDLRARRVLDVGTGSGVLAVAARALGAAEVTGLDVDRDAIQAAAENLDANRFCDGVRFVVGDLRDVPLGEADVVTANLMGALLVQTADRLQAAVKPGGTLVVSGLLDHERQAVVDALSTRSALTLEMAEDGWLALGFTRLDASAV